MTNDVITAIVDWQMSHQPQERHTCRTCRTFWIGPAGVCPECGVVQ